VSSEKRDAVAVALGAKGAMDPAGQDFDQRSDSKPRASSKSRIAEGSGPRLDFSPQRLDIGMPDQTCLEILQFLPLLLLDLECDLAAAVKEEGDLF